MFELIGLNGTRMLVSINSIFRIKAVLIDGTPEVEIEYTAGYLFSNEPLTSLLGRIGNAIRLIAFPTRGGSLVYLNVALISAIRPALPINAPGTEIMVAAHYQHVLESYDHVVERLNS